jgi:class 3 adenylate cyclase
VARHDAILRGAVDVRGGHVFSTGGDALCAAFARAGDALGAARDAQRALQAESWPEPVTMRVRMGVHTGVADERDGDYFGTAVNRAARLMSWPTAGRCSCRWLPRS